MAHNVNCIPLMNRFLNVSGQRLLFDSPTKPMKGGVGSSQSRGPQHSSLSLGLTLVMSDIKHIVLKLSGKNDGAGAFSEPKVASQKMENPFGTKIWKPKPEF